MRHTHAILYHAHGEPTTLALPSTVIDGAIANGATTYSDQTTTLRVVMPGANHDRAWTAVSR